MLLAETQTQSLLLGWLDQQYEVVRRGYLRVILQTGSASKRGIVKATRPSSGSKDTDSVSTVQMGNSLRVTSQYFNVSTHLLCSTQLSYIFPLTRNCQTFMVYGRHHKNAPEKKKKMENKIISFANVFQSSKRFGICAGGGGGKPRFAVVCTECY